MLLFILLVGIALFILFFPVLKPFLIQVYRENSPLLVEYLWAIIPLAILIAISRLLVHYTSNFHRIVIPSLFQDFLIKLTLPILILLIITDVINSLQFVYGLIIHYSLVCVLLTGYLTWLGTFKIESAIKKYWKRGLKRLTKYGFYSVLWLLLEDRLTFGLIL